MSHATSSKILTYTVLFERAHEGGFIATVPLLPGCMSQGASFETAQENIRDAIRGYLQVLREDGEEIPMEAEEHIAATVAVPLPA